MNISSQAKLIPPTTTRTRTSARGTPTEQPVRRVSVQLLRGSLINNMGSRAFGSLGNNMGRRTRSSPSPDGNHYNGNCVSLPFRVALHMHWPHEGKEEEEEDEEGGPKQLWTGSICHLRDSCGGVKWGMPYDFVMECEVGRTVQEPLWDCKHYNCCCCMQLLTFFSFPSTALHPGSPYWLIWVFLLLLR